MSNCVKEDVDFCVNCGNLLFAEDLNEDPKKWSKEKWVRFVPMEKLGAIVLEDPKSEGKCQNVYLGLISY